MNDEVHLFSYGTLQDPRVQLATFGRLVEGRPDAIAGYTLGEVHIDDPSVVQASGSAVHPVLTASSDPDAEVAGMVLTITEDELAAADGYEVDAYARVEVALRSGMRAWVYALSAGSAAESSER